MLSRSTLLRYILVAATSAMSAMALVTTAVYAHNDGFNERIVACFDSRDPDSEQCRAALEVSPVGADFFTRLAANVQMPQPKPEPKPELYALLKECAATKNIDSDECARAIDASGLSPEDFKAKFASKLACISVQNNERENPCPAKKPECASASNHDEDNPCAKNRTTKPDCASTSNNDETNPCAQRTTKPECASTNNQDEVNPCATKPSVVMTAALKECFSLRGSMSGLSAHELIAKAERAAAVCRQAWFESRLSAGEFWTKH
jgi:hypothetical protein